MRTRILTVLAAFLLNISAYAQLSTNELPISFKENIQLFVRAKITMVELPVIDVEYSGAWTQLPDGGKLWQLGFFCPDALSINLLYDKFWLPARLVPFKKSPKRKEGKT